MLDLMESEAVKISWRFLDLQVQKDVAEICEEYYGL